MIKMVTRFGNYTDEIFKILDIASRITIFFYALLIDISVFERLIKLTGKESIWGYLFLAVGLVIFVLHRILKPNKNKSADFMHSFIYNLLLSFALTLFLLSFVFTFFKEILNESSVILSGMGRIMLTNVTIFVYILVLALIDRFLKGTNIIRSLAIFISLFLIFMFGMSQVSRNEAAGSVGLFLLGPVNLLIINILFGDFYFVKQFPN